MKGYRYGVNVHETKSQSIQGNTKQWNNAFIVVRHLEVTKVDIFDVAKKHFINGDEIQKLFKMLALKRS
jgi:hypothetical protein